MKYTSARWHVGTILLFLAVVPTCRLACQDTIPAGFGTLRRDDIVARFSTGTLEIQVLPLDEQVIRLLAPDTYRSLAQLVRSRAADLADAAARGSTPSPTLVMVTFLGVVPGARFNPEELNITNRCGRPGAQISWRRGSRRPRSISSSRGSASAKS